MSVEIVAEVAQGYEGDAKLAQLLANAAVHAGADSVKFQIVYVEELAAPGYVYFDLFKELEMEPSAWQLVEDIVHGAGRNLYFDIFGERGLALAKTLSADGVKIHATDFFNTELVKEALASFSKVFLSLGGIHEEELDEFLLEHAPAPGQCVLMHGFQAEPTPMAANNINRIKTLKQRYTECSVGFMDHSDGGLDEGETLALLSLPYGVSCIEKHITLDRVLKLEDYASGLSPSDFRRFVDRIHHLEPALGSAELGLGKGEVLYRQKVLKVAVASSCLLAGTVLKREHLKLLRVGIEVPHPVYRIEELVGRTVEVAVNANDPIMKDMIS